VTSPLRVAVVGCGNIAQMMHLPTLAERPDLFAIEALVDTNEAVLHAVGERYRVPTDKRYTDVQGALGQEVEAVLVLHGGSHKEATLRALDASKHVFVEKPLGYSRAETEQIIARAKQSRGLLMVGYQKRFNPAYRAARELVREMAGLRYVDVTVLHPDDGDYSTHHAILPLRPPKAPVSEQDDLARTHAALSSGPMSALLDEVVGPGKPVAHKLAAKVLTESLIHDLNLLRDSLGEPEQVLSSHVWNGGLAQQALVQFAGGVHVNLSWVAVPGLKNYDEYVRFVGPTSRVMLQFPSPYLRHTPAPLTVERMEGEQLVVEQRVVSHDDPFRLELHHFRECVARNQVPLTGASDALGDARFIESLARAYA
jgi:predicted dehydrogenase